MSIEERIEYAVKKRDEAISNEAIQDIVYWNGYIDGLKAVMHYNG
jgi:HJR/Mrr/RecB family endonuclease